MKAFNFEIKEDNCPRKGLVWVTTSNLEDMYKEAKYEWEHLPDWRCGEDFHSDRVHTLEMMIQESRKGKYIFMRTSKY